MRIIGESYRVEIMGLLMVSGFLSLCWMWVDFILALLSI
tara:strand:+ start:103 stop:219 length:117 start_codon:yes stop_codon:yes gene_type:complete